MYLTGFTARQTCSASCRSVLPRQYIHRGWNPYVAAVGRATRLYELNVELWMAVSFIVCHNQSDWPAWR